MLELEARLVRCYQAVFPMLDEAAVRTATPDHVPTWDSLATVTLLRLVEEEFEEPIDLLDLNEPGFESLLSYLLQRLPV